MPTYEYACTSCGNEWEFEQSIKDEALKKCPKCKKQTARRQISRGAGFILKGGGWYSDLYSSPGNKGGSGANATGEKSESKSAGAESKSAGAESKSSSSESKSESTTKTESPKGDKPGPAASSSPAANS